MFNGVFFVFQGSPEPMETHFMLADSVFCKASVPPTEKVCLWLGVSERQASALSAAKAARQPCLCFL